ncbi:hypothetical protein COO60DRAFT_217421 [Scenedesmus sp. NREL 46B-D3]|nr:hypothetical protein COO60DRAFT_217421 [Scenedesmus sp. NREL 46B-D3]
MVGDFGDRAVTRSQSILPASNTLSSTLELIEQQARDLALADLSFDSDSENDTLLSPVAGHTPTRVFFNPLCSGDMEESPGTSTLSLLKLKRYAGKASPSTRTCWQCSRSGSRACVTEQRPKAGWPAPAAAAAPLLPTLAAATKASSQDRECAASLQQALQYANKSQVNLERAKDLVKSYQEHKQQQLQVLTESNVAASMLGKAAGKQSLSGWQARPASPNNPNGSRWWDERRPQQQQQQRQQQQRQQGDQRYNICLHTAHNDGVCWYNEPQRAAEHWAPSVEAPYRAIQVYQRRCAELGIAPKMPGAHHAYGGSRQTGQCAAANGHDWTAGTANPSSSCTP